MANSLSTNKMKFICIDVVYSAVINGSSTNGIGKKMETDDEK